MYSDCFGTDLVVIGEAFQPPPVVAALPAAPARASKPTTTELIGWIMLDRQIRLLAQRMQAA